MPKSEVLSLLEGYYNSTKAKYLAHETATIDDKLERKKLFGILMGYESSMILIRTM